MDDSPHILVTNDDGITAPGLLALVQGLKGLSRLSILAPDHNWSASGHVKTMHKPLRVKDVELDDGTEALASNGAPSDCVALAMLGLIDEVDLVVSGINPNANLGHDVTYSGTVTAAMEAVIWEKPGLAVSLDGSEDHLGKLDYGPAAALAGRVARLLLGGSLPPDVVYNLNVPALPADKIAGIEVTRQGLREYRDELVTRKDPRGKPYYWIGGEPPTGSPDQGTDIGALAAGYASLTPLKLDLTAEGAVDEIRSALAHLPEVGGKMTSNEEGK